MNLRSMTEIQFAELKAKIASEELFRSQDSLTLKLPIEGDARYSGDANAIFDYARTHHGDAIVEWCGIDFKTEYQLDNFGPGSAWLFESAFALGIEFNGDNTYVVITRVT